MLKILNVMKTNKALKLSKTSTLTNKSFFWRFIFLYVYETA